MTLTITQVSTSTDMFDLGWLFVGDFAASSDGDVLLVDNNEWWSRSAGAWTRFGTTTPIKRPRGVKLGTPDGTTRGIMSSDQSGFLLFGDTAMRSRPLVGDVGYYYLGGDDWDSDVVTGDFESASRRPRYDDYRYPVVVSISGNETAAGPWSVRLSDGPGIPEST